MNFYTIKQISEMTEATMVDCWKENDYWILLFNSGVKVRIKDF